MYTAGAVNRRCCQAARPTAPHANLSRAGSGNGKPHRPRLQAHPLPHGRQDPLHPMRLQVIHATDDVTHGEHTHAHFGHRHERTVDRHTDTRARSDRTSVTPRVGPGQAAQSPVTSPRCPSPNSPGDRSGARQPRDSTTEYTGLQQLPSLRGARLWIVMRCHSRRGRLVEACCHGRWSGPRQRVCARDCRLLLRP